MLEKEELKFISEVLFSGQWNGQMWTQKVMPLMQKLHLLINPVPQPEEKKDDN